VALQTSVLTPVSPDLTLNEDNPLGKIPALRLDDGNVIHDSRVILDYLDHQHVGNPLIPREGSARWRPSMIATMPKV
jgi:glutathione S-transferase